VRITYPPREHSALGSLRLPLRAAALALARLGVSCATTKAVVENAHTVAKGGSIDRAGLKHALASDRESVGNQLVELRKKVLQAFAALRSNVQKHWGQRETKIASRTVYVKYTQGYRTRVVTDFDHGVVTIETLDTNDSLKRAIVTALLTPNDPAAADLFSDKDVTLASSRTPYLYGLVHDRVTDYRRQFVGAGIPAMATVDTAVMAK